MILIPSEVPKASCCCSAVAASASAASDDELAAPDVVVGMEKYPRLFVGKSGKSRKISSFWGATWESLKSSWKLPILTQNLIWPDSNSTIALHSTDHTSGHQRLYRGHLLPTVMAGFPQRSLQPNLLEHYCGGQAMYQLSTLSHKCIMPCFAMS